MKQRTFFTSTIDLNCMKFMEILFNNEQHLGARAKRLQNFPGVDPYIQQNFKIKLLK